MAEPEEIADSPVGWVAKHIARYTGSDGADGHRYSGLPTLLLTTRGRRSGRLRRTALIYGEHDQGYVVVGSNGGADKHPLWYLNLVEEPDVTVQIRGDVFAARARDATAEERPGLWTMMRTVFPTYGTYEKKTRRVIPVVVLQPTAGPAEQA